MRTVTRSGRFCSPPTPLLTMRADESLWAGARTTRSRRSAPMAVRWHSPQVAPGTRIYITDVDATNVDLLTPFAFGDENYRSGADWSPDGRSVAMSAMTGGVFQVMTLNLRDRSLKQLTSDGRNEDPSWAPDSRHVVFTSNRTGVKQLWVLDVESGRGRQLTFGTEARLSAWSRPLV